MLALMKYLAIPCLASFCVSPDLIDEMEPLVSYSFSDSRVPGHPPSPGYPLLLLAGFGWCWRADVRSLTGKSPRLTVVVTVGEPQDRDWQHSYSWLFAGKIWKRWTCGAAEASMGTIGQSDQRTMTGRGRT